MMASALWDSLERSLLRDSCGCAMGARFMIVALAIAAPYYALLARHHVIGGWSAAGRVFICLFLASSIGKVLGLVLHRRLTQRAKRRAVPASHG